MQKSLVEQLQKDIKAQLEGEVWDALQAAQAAFDERIKGVAIRIANQAEFTLVRLANSNGIEVQITFKEQK